MSEHQMSSRPGLGTTTLLMASLSLERLFSHPFGDVSMYLCQLREWTASHRNQCVGKGLSDHYNTEKSTHEKEYQGKKGGWKVILPLYAAIVRLLLE